MIEKQTDLITVLNDEMLQNMNQPMVMKIAHPSLAVLSNNDNIMYFTGVPTNSKFINIAGLRSYPTSIFSYNMDTKEIKVIYTPFISSWIHDLNIKQESVYSVNSNINKNIISKIELAEELIKYNKVKNEEQVKALADFLEYLFLIEDKELENKYEEYKRERGGAVRMTVD